MMKIEDLKPGDEVRNTKTGSVGVIRPNLRPFTNPNIGWVEVQVTKSVNGKQFTSFWSLRNIELINSNKMAKYEVTPDNIREYMNNYESDFPLKIDDKAGLDFKDEETKAILHNSCIYQKKSKTRCVKLEITSFRGISWGAMHYYGKLMADGIDFQCLDDPKTTTSNWDAKKINPFYQWRYEFDLRRPTTEEEINNDPDRWRGYYPGSFTTSFDTKEEIIELAKQCFKMRFTGDWELWVDDSTVAKNGVYQIEL